MKFENILNSIAITVVVCAAGLSHPVQAQSNRLVFTTAQTTRCLAGAEMPEDLRACIGRSADACVNATPGGGSTVGMGGCLSRELGFWDARLNHVYQQTMAREKQTDAENASGGFQTPSAAAALRKMQRAWIPYRDARCAYEQSQWAGGTGGGPAFISCLMWTTAEQTLFLEQMAY